MGNLHVFEAVSVDPEADKRFTLFAIGFDVNVGGALSIGVGNDLIGQPDDGTVVLVEPTSGILRCRLLGFADEFAENVGDIFI